MTIRRHDRQTPRLQDYEVRARIEQEAERLLTDELLESLESCPDEAAALELIEQRVLAPLERRARKMARDDNPSQGRIPGSLAIIRGG